MALKDYKIFFIIGGLVLLIIIFLVVKNQLDQPMKELQELNKTITEQKERITELESSSNTSGVTTPSDSKVNVWTIVFFIGFVLCIIYIIFSRVKSSDAKNREELIKHIRKYCKEKDGIELFKVIKYAEGYYKADHEFPIALLLFTTLKTWNNEIEPPASSIYGYLVDRANPDNVLEDFMGMSVDDVMSAIKETTWGMRTPHYKPYKTKSYEEQALKQFGAREEAIQEAVAFKKAVEERA